MPRLPYRFLRLKLFAYGLIPRTRLARFTLYVAAVDLLFYLVLKLFHLAGSVPGWVAALDMWIRVLTVLVVGLAAVLALRWVRQRLMWRLRNRLIVTYIFIGVIPVALLAVLAGSAGLLLAGQFATFLASSDIQSELKALQASNDALTAALAMHVERTGVLTETALQPLVGRDEHFPERQVTVWFRGKPIALTPGAPVSVPPMQEKEGLRAVAAENRALHLRAAKTALVRGDRLTVVSSVPLDKAMLERIAEQLGQIVIARTFRAQRASSSGTRERDRGGRFAIEVDPTAGSPESRREQLAAEFPTLRAGTAPQPAGALDIVGVEFVTPFPVLDWPTGQVVDTALLVRTRPPMLYHRLFWTLGINASAILVALKILAGALAVMVFLALLVGARLTRSMTSAVAALYEATEHINRGDLSHRISVSGRDQLAALGTSFNAMAESLDRLLAEQKEKQRIQNELAIAQEVQEQLFPRDLRPMTMLEVHGVCRPARTVSGDYYDFLDLGREKLGIAAGDVSGKGISAALLMATLHSAIRAYTLDRARAVAEMHAMAGSGAARGRDYGGPGDGDDRLSPAELLTLLNRQLYRTTPPEKYATLFFSTWAGATRTLTYSNAGHLPPVVMGGDGSLRRLDCGGTVVGLFPEITLDETSVVLRPDDVFIAFSDGITEPENEFGEFGEQRLIELIYENRRLPLDRISEAVTTAVRDWIGGNEQPDDITLVLARAR